jgi:16S rRNA (cytosine1402-N4)-methyltransferase
MMTAPHVPVLLEAVLHYLQPEPGRRIVDGTYGYGGHAAACLARGADVLGLDLDSDAVAACRRAGRRHEHLHCRKASFRNLDVELKDSGWLTCDGVLLDLGVNSRQLDDPAKGFTYRSETELDLRFDRRTGRSASALMRDLSEAELADLMWRYGEERFSRRLARAVTQAMARQPLQTTSQLRAVVEAALPSHVRPMATLSRVFQALRIAVNDELGALASFLERAPRCLEPGGRIVIISYHSLEDRLVKRWIDKESRDCVCPPESPACRCEHERILRPLTRKAIRPDAAEAAANPRARSAKLRAAQLLDQADGSR